MLDIDVRDASFSEKCHPIALNRIAGHRLVDAQVLARDSQPFVEVRRLQLSVSTQSGEEKRRRVFAVGVHTIPPLHMVEAVDTLEQLRPLLPVFRDIDLRVVIEKLEVSKAQVQQLLWACQTLKCQRQVRLKPGVVPKVGEQSLKLLKRESIGAAFLSTPLCLCAQVSDRIGDKRFIDPALRITLWKELPPDKLQVFAKVHPAFFALKGVIRCGNNRVYLLSTERLKWVFGMVNDEDQHLKHPQPPDVAGVPALELLMQCPKVQQVCLILAGVFTPVV